MYLVPLTKSGTKAVNWKLPQNPGDMHRYSANLSIFRDVYCAFQKGYIFADQTFRIEHCKQANNQKLLSVTIRLLIFTHSKVQPGLCRTPQYLEVSISVGEIHQFYCVQCKHTDQ